MRKPQAAAMCSGIGWTSHLHAEARRIGVTIITAIEQRRFYLKQLDETIFDLCQQRVCLCTAAIAIVKSIQ